VLSFQPGTRLGPYELLSMLGKGGMGEVYRALDTRLDRTVAIKVLPRELATDETYRRRLEREAKTIAQLQHPCVCALHDVGSEPEAPFFLVMEHLVGETLEDRIRRGPMELEAALSIAREIAEAMEAAHRRGVVHRDLKPGNVMLTEHGTKVLDFGLAKEFGGRGSGLDSEGTTHVSPISAEGMIVGTLPYMAPEQVQGEAADARTDLWALGCIVYEMFTGARPFAGPSQAALIASILEAKPVPLVSRRPDAPERLGMILQRCFDRDPERRWQSARDLGLELALVGEGPAADRSAVTMPAAGPEEKTVEIVRNPVAAAVAGGAAAEPDLTDTDVFIACTRVDDEPLAMGETGWISDLQRKLQVRVEQLAGEPVKVSLAMVSDTTQAKDPLLPALHSAKAMIAVVTPSFVRSESCRQVVESFWQQAERSSGVFVGSQPRLFKVVKTPTAQDEVPPGLGALFSQLLDFEFYEEEPESGRVRELDERLAPETRQRYHERIYDVAREVQRTLASLRAGPSRLETSAGDAKVVYLAQASSDIQPDTDRLRRELTARGHVVVPDRPLPMVAGELEAAIRSHLERADLSIHPIGRHYGLIPEGAESSIVELQNLWAAERSRSAGLERVIWLVRGADPESERQRAFVERLREEPEAHSGAEVLHDSLDNTRALVLDRLSPKAPARPAAAGDAPPRIYLICEQGDEEAIEPLEDFLFEQGFEVSLPDFEADEAEAAEIHRRNLVDCDAVIVLYGAARHAWVDIKLRGLLKARGYGREDDLSAQAVVVMPPFDRRKERFRSHQADVIRQQDRFRPELLSDFVKRLRAAGG
jgi:hypothetical protein